MKYIEMTIEEALKYSKGNKEKVVLVAIQDLEKDELPEFIKTSKVECECIIQQAETIARVYDEFVNQLRVFTEKQDNIRKITRYGNMSTILIRSHKE